MTSQSQISLVHMYKESNAKEIMEKVVIPIIAEFCSMFLLTFWGAMSTPPSRQIEITALNRTIHPAEWTSSYLTSALMPAFQAGFAVWMIIVVFWRISVVNFNPVISTCLMITGDLSPYLFLPYIIVQLMGAVFGAVVVQALKNDVPGPFLISDDANISAILVYEMFATGLLCFFANVMVGDKEYNQATGPMAIGFVVFQGVLAGYWIGAGCMNPIRAMGSAIVMGGSTWNHHWVWWVGDFLGGLVSVLIYRFFFAPPDKVWIIKVFKYFKREDQSNRNHIDLESQI